MKIMNKNDVQCKVLSQQKEFTMQIIHIRSLMQII